MRLRYAIGSALGALALVVTIPTSANAATGTFTYYPYGSTEALRLTDPTDEVCHKLGSDDEAAYEHGKNGTDLWAIVYTDEGCTGEEMTLGSGKETINDFTFRSVRFQ
ncbi:hypothetical protein EKH77_27040 [Streptomyces luteoverticillatus]|uniref:Uncharacterized protein n=1 Tax=Streptomyces luteoverticillatus TaxID=66425 RepID=A0A3S9PPX0_STRLT|nr:hypothetical protein [Streptomyces luteoverticillatus]AZQ74377.1 hypothetical protein EKH77_27040 [Streptomyces luteoverticillatus]